MTFKPPKYEDN